jgi:hypothetical protein
VRAQPTLTPILSPVDSPELFGGGSGSAVDAVGKLRVKSPETVVVEADVVELSACSCVVVGTKPACQTTLWPGAVGNGTMLVSLEALVNATILEVNGQKQKSALVMIDCFALWEHATH